MLIPLFTGTRVIEGIPQAGGSIRVTGTGSDVELFADPAFKTALPNPAPLNSIGLGPCLYVASGKVYTVEVLNADGDVVQSGTYSTPVATDPVPIFGGVQVKANGEPNAAGLVYAYQPGSFSIPATMWYDAGFTTELSNPVVMTVLGEVGVSIYIASGEAVSFVQTDAEGTVVTTIPYYQQP